MASLRSDVGFLRHLVTFEAASRSKNFTHTAAELGLTRVAVSRQIAELEQALGKKLFVRGHRHVTLTADGQMLAAGANPALVQLADTLHRVRCEAPPTRLTLTTTIAFATYWLMPRLSDFGTRYPGVDLNLVVSDKYLDLGADDIDVAIRYGGTSVRDGRRTKLCREEIFPVFSPNYVKRTALLSVADLRQERLLHLSGNYRPEARWPYWFSKQGLDAPQERSGVMVNTYVNMLQAAIEGQGVGLAGSPLVDRLVDAGLLLRMDGIAPLKRDWFYLIERSPEKDAVALFVNWVRGPAGVQASQNWK